MMNDEINRDLRDLVIRLDERLSSLDSKFDNMTVQFKEFEQRLEAKFVVKPEHEMLSQRVDRLEKKLKDDYVPRAELQPVIDTHKALTEKIRANFIGGIFVVLVLIVAAVPAYQMWKVVNEISVQVHPK